MASDDVKIEAMCRAMADADGVDANAEVDLRPRLVGGALVVDRGPAWRRYWVLASRQFYAEKAKP